MSKDLDSMINDYDGQCKSVKGLVKLPFNDMRIIRHDVQHTDSEQLACACHLERTQLNMGADALRVLLGNKNAKKRSRRDAGADPPDSKDENELDFGNVKLTKSYCKMTAMCTALGLTGLEGISNKGISH